MKKRRMTGEPAQSPESDLADELRTWLEVQRQACARRQRQQERQRRRRRLVRQSVAVLGVYAVFATVLLVLNEGSPAWTSFVLATANTFAVTSTTFFLLLETRRLRDGRPQADADADSKPSDD